MGNQKEGSLIVKEKVLHAGSAQLRESWITERPAFPRDVNQGSLPVTQATNSPLLKTKPQISSPNNNGSSLTKASDSYICIDDNNLVLKQTNYRGQSKMKKRAKFGMEVVLDLYDCDPKIIRSAKALRNFAEKMCKVLKMKKYGQALTPHFGHDDPKTSGYSLLQFIETSSITGHFSEGWNSAYINIFSCRMFGAKKAINFTKKYFKAKEIVARKIIRA